MKKGSAQGFTVIEVILFLALTGLIMTVMLAGISTNLNQERYRDANTSLIGFFQDQYSNVMNVSNVRAKDEPCTGGASDGGRGTSDCFIVGRLLSSTAAGNAITSRAVHANSEYMIGDPTLDGKTDIQILQAADLSLSDQVDTYTMEWGTSLVDPVADGGAKSAFTLLIVRMPTTGVVHTYLASSAGREPVEILADAAPTAPLVLCIEPDGLLNPGQARRGVQVVKDAVNSAGVKPVYEGGC